MSKENDTLCWECQNACGGCSWSKSFIPVDSWEAIKTTINQSNYAMSHSYIVLSCPLFKQDKNGGREEYYKEKRNEFVKKHKISVKTFTRWLDKGKVIKTENGYEIDKLYKIYVKSENDETENDY